MMKEAVVIESLRSGLLFRGTPQEIAHIHSIAGPIGSVGTSWAKLRVRGAALDFDVDCRRLTAAEIERASRGHGKEA